MPTLDEMLSLQLLTADQHAQICAWNRHARTPDRILQMPGHLWRALEIACLLMDFDGTAGDAH